MAKEIKTRNPEKYDYAHLLFMSGSNQKEIAKKVGTTEATISKWVRDGGWEAKRAAATISPEQVASKLLMRLNSMLEAGTNFDPVAFAKIARQLKEFKPKAGLDELIYTFMSFGAWLDREAITDSAITPELIRVITDLQDRFILSKRNETE